MKKWNMTSWALFLVLVLVLARLPWAEFVAAQIPSTADSPKAFLRSALERAQQAEGYRVVLDARQTVAATGASSANQDWSGAFAQHLVHRAA